MRVAKLMTGGATAVPIIEEVTGISNMAPPPPDTVEMIKATMPATNRPTKCQFGMCCNRSKTMGTMKSYSRNYTK